VNDEDTPYTNDCKRISFFLLNSRIEEIDDIINKKPQLFNNRGHFIRCAVERALRERRRYK
jgi:hypothetical protein